MNQKKSILFASFFVLSLFVGCEKPPDHSACEQQLEKVKTNLQTERDSLNDLLKEAQSQNTHLEEMLGLTRDSLIVYQKQSKFPKVLEHPMKGEPIRTNGGPKPGERPMGRK